MANKSFSSHRHLTCEPCNISFQSRLPVAAHPTWCRSSFEPNFTRRKRKLANTTIYMIYIVYCEFHTLKPHPHKLAIRLPIPQLHFRAIWLSLLLKQHKTEVPPSCLPPRKSTGRSFDRGKRYLTNSSVTCKPRGYSHMLKPPPFLHQLEAITGVFAGAARRTHNPLQGRTS